MLIELLLLAQASAATAQTPASAPAPKPHEQKMICHFEQIGASRISQRICHTKDEWDQIERAAEDSFKDNMGKQNNAGNTPE
jgi:predicted secreted protein